MRFIGLGTRGSRRVPVGRSRAHLLGLGLGALVLGALIGVGWALADTGSRAEAAETGEPSLDLTSAVLLDEVTSVVEPVVEETADRVDPVVEELLGTLGCGEPVRACAEESPTAVVRTTTDLVGELVTHAAGTPAAVTATETSVRPARGVLQNLTGVLASLTGAPDAASTGGSADVAAPAERAGTADTSLPRTAARPPDTGTTGAKSPSVRPAFDGQPHPTATTGKAGHHPPGGPVAPLTPCPDAGTSGGASVVRCPGGGQHGDGAVLPSAEAWFGSAQSDALLAAGAHAPPAERASEHTVAPD
ncbi:hypothetical protein [Phytomonospora endophytica]|uniref:Uncharacterized protein n=1 Tax=Phytomonospora endophytica TaxID=714109 RepID=A0A841FHG4_9ACTN|nr:hypothetical protein [Phytomonospora endophytica]MBB6033288.1 hypothetical protein [Phytomonospora endophytica]GIG65515.1 hypothetical protein Pen01_18100 [Phytomonospora endophytica]